MAELHAGPLDPVAVEASVRRPGAGGVAVFVGRVRDDDAGRAVVALDYSAHPDAAEVLAALVAEALTWDAVLAADAVHRVGRLEVGDAAIVVAVACAHRREAFGACERLVDEIKHRLPVWKRQVFADGSQEWVGAC